MEFPRHLITLLVATRSGRIDPGQLRLFMDDVVREAVAAAPPKYY